MTERSEEAVVQALSAVLRDHGWAVARNAKRLRGSLSDVLGVDADAHRGALDAVVLAVEEGIVGELRDAGRQHVDALLPGMVERLTEWGPDRDRATWAVRTWVSHLPEATLPPPTTTEPPGTQPQGLEPTTLPPAAAPSAIAPSAAPSAAAVTSGASPVVPPDVTLAPPHPARPNASGPRGRRLSRRGAAVGAAVAVAVLVAGGVAAAVNWPEVEQGPTSSSSESGPTGPSATTPTPPPPVEGGVVVGAASARVPVADSGVAMAARTGGVRVARLGDVETVGSGEAERSAPEGGRLIAFRLVDWPCERGSCRTWKQLGLRVELGGAERRLPRADGADTFVVAVPPGASDVDLVMKADGLRQTLSLVTGKPGRDNVAVLARKGRVDRIGERFTLTERTSEAFDYGGRVTDTVPRDVSVTRAELAFFTDHGRPSSPRRAFLKVRADYTIPIGSFAGERYAFELREISFVARDGTTYRARDIDEGPGVDAVFEVPADLRGGTFRMGGGSYPVSSNGLTFTRTVAERSIPIRFG